MAWGLIRGPGDAVPSVRQVLRGDHEADDALLAVPARELVAELRDPLVADLDLDELRDVLALRQDHVVDPAGLAEAHRDARLAALLGREQVGLLFEEPRRAGLPDQHVAFGDLELREMRPSSPRLRYAVSTRAPATSGRGISKRSSGRPGTPAPHHGTSGRTTCVRDRARSRPSRRRARPGCCTPRRRGRRRRSSAPPAAR